MGRCGDGCARALALARASWRSLETPIFCRFQICMKTTELTIGSAWGDYDCATTWMAVLQSIWYVARIKIDHQHAARRINPRRKHCTSGNKGQSNYYRRLHKIVVNHFGIHELDYPAGKACTRRIWALHYIPLVYVSEQRGMHIPTANVPRPINCCTCATTTICTAMRTLLETLLFIIPKLSVQICRYACMESRIAMPDCTKIK